MPSKIKLEPEKVFDNIYTKYYLNARSGIFNELLKGNEVYPSPEAKEKMISQYLSVNCTYRFIYYSSQEIIEPMDENDDKFPFSGITGVKKFYQLIHPAFLLPYLIYGRFAYEVMLMSNPSREQLMSASYQIALPIKFPRQDEYSWYIQRSNALSFNEKNMIYSHTSTFHFERKFMFLDDFEYRFIEATVLQNERLHESFQMQLKKRLTEYYRDEVFLKQHWDVLQAGINNSAKLKYTKNTLYAYNKEIIAIMKAQTGYAFGSIHAVVTYLERIKVLP